MDNGWSGRAYDEVSDPQRRWGADVVDRLLGRLAPGPVTVLDAGCGSGRVTDVLLRRRPDVRVVAGDVTPSMVDAAGERLAAHGDRVRLVALDLAADVAATLGPMAPFDAVLSTGVFHWVRDHRRMFAGLCSVLAPGGVLVAQCGGAGSVLEARELVARLGHDWRGLNHYPDARETAEALRGGGFVDVTTWLSDEHVRFGTRAELAGYLRDGVLAPYLADLPDGERRQVSATVADRLAEPVLRFVRCNLVARRPGT